MIARFLDWIAIRFLGRPEAQPDIWAAMQGVLNIDDYNSLVGTLKQQGALEESHHYLRRGAGYDKALKVLRVAIEAMK